MNTIQKKWEAFARDVVPVDAPTVQRVEMKKAFYAGAQAVLSITWELGSANVSENAGAAIMEGLYQEAHGFGALILKEKT